jgi:hypothetical protein
MGASENLVNQYAQDVMLDDHLYPLLPMHQLAPFFALALY